MKTIRISAEKSAICKIFGVGESLFRENCILQDGSRLTSPWGVIHSLYALAEDVDYAIVTVDDYESNRQVSCMDVCEIIDVLENHDVATQLPDLLRDDYSVAAYGWSNRCGCTDHVIAKDATHEEMFFRAVMEWAKENDKGTWELNTRKPSF